MSNHQESAMFSISIVEKKTGVNKFLLRMWERRYDFPKPLRDEKGERIYSEQDIKKLILVKKLMELGDRPSKVIKLSLESLEQKLASLVNDIKIDAKNEKTVFVLAPLELEGSLEEWIKNERTNARVLKVTSRQELNSVMMDL